MNGPSDYSTMLTPKRQQPYRQCLLFFLLAVLSVITTSGCSSRSYVQHLASDAILIVPHQSTQKEIVSLLGQPEQRKKLSDGAEEWIYFQTKQSFLRKTPYIGKKFGHEAYDLVIIHFKGDLVTSSTYRLLTEEEFKASGIKSENQLNAK